MAVEPSHRASSSTDVRRSSSVANTHGSSLYVGDLHPAVTEGDLFDIFSRVGPVASVRICRDATTRRSLGYAYVNYNSSLDSNAAERALATLNYHQIHGRPIRLMWSFRDPSFRKSGVGNIFIKNLDKSIDNKSLHEKFSTFGEILSCKVATDDMNVSKGYGFVHFATEESAQLAVIEVNGSDWHGKELYVGPFKPRTDASEDLDGRFTNVYVKDFGSEVTEEDLCALFSKYGSITSCVVMKDGAGVSRGFGFVNFASSECASNAIAEMNGADFNGKTLHCSRAQKRSEREALLKMRYNEPGPARKAQPGGLNLFVRNLAMKVDDTRLREEFEPFGVVTSARVMRDANGNSRGFGFVCYTSSESAAKAVVEMSNKMVEGKPLYVALAQHREERQARLEQQYHQRAMAQMQGQGMGPGPEPSPGLGHGPGALVPYTPVPPMMYAAGHAMPGPWNPYLMFPPMMPHGVPYSAMGPHGMLMGPPGMMIMAGGRGWHDGGRGRGAGGRGDRGDGAGQWSEARVMGQNASSGHGNHQQHTLLDGPSTPVTPGTHPKGRTPYAATPVSSAATPAHAKGGHSRSMPQFPVAMPPDQRQQVLGEELFPLVRALQPELAGKITGMLLEMSESDVCHMLSNPTALQSNVDAAVRTLRQYQAKHDGLSPTTPGASEAQRAQENTA